MGERGKNGPVSEGVEYFKHFKSEHTPNVTWQQMIEQGVVIGPQALRDTLADARHFIETEPGPNLERRRKLAPGWFNTWNRIVWQNSRQDKSGLELIGAGSGLVSFDSSSSLLGRGPEEGFVYISSGMLFLAGGEGHEGHRHAAKYMASKVNRVVWGFEQESYLQRKTRGGSFLSLPVRLSMWHYNPYVDIVTVLPDKPIDVGENEHYDDLFERSGADYYFVDEADPHLNLKIKRGKIGVGTLSFHTLGWQPQQRGLKNYNMNQYWKRVSLIGLDLSCPA